MYIYIYVTMGGWGGGGLDIFYLTKHNSWNSVQLHNKCILLLS